ncbi:MAG TPA: hypothetical protein VKR61_02735 [Bryobacteraceae bacterium]|nr:hypothetical protein [Bryobacteraceae bacterium]
MKFSADDFRRRYADMPDLELLSLRRDELSLTARQVYDAEMLRRGMDPAPAETASPGREKAPPELPAEPDPGMDAAAEQQEDEDLAPAAVYRSRSEAKDARERLQEAFIPTFLENDEMAADWTPSSALGSFRLLVPASYLAQAREILALPAIE